MPEKISKDIVVTLKYKLFLDDGELVEETDAERPLVYLHGHRNLIPGLEREIEGMATGESRRVIVEAANAYGDYDEDALMTVPRADLPNNIPFEEGLVLNVTDGNDNQSLATVAEVTDLAVTLDFNHPLAGERLTFEVEIEDLREATNDELSHGHVHGVHGHQH